MRVFHIMRYKWWYLGSLTAVTVFAFIFVFIIGLDFGIDFKGGTRYEVGLEKTATVDQVRSIVTAAGVKDPVVQSAAGAGGAESFLITAKDMSTTQLATVKADLTSRFGIKSGSESTDTVGASFGKETTNRAFIAIAIAVVAIIGYLSFRFEFKYAIPAIVALIHDVGLTLGIYAASNRLVTTATVAAILTILGYSVHDTIVVFDRMRENTQFIKRETFSDMADLSIRQTMVRSINTSVCVLLPLLAILIFGGPTLKDFAFALTIGVVTGTYSSIFVATPLVVLWKEREPRYRKRLAAAAASAGNVMVEIDESEMPERKPSGDARRASPGAQAQQPAIARKPAGRVSQKPRKGKTSKRPVAKGTKRTSR
ncbi:MAG: protein translocase subunit SecF [Actinobacteria bacterium]|nr:protein translocase subunit SecF [Actinomycetota bacterium]